MTAERLLAEVSSRELTAWMAFYQAEASERSEAEAKQRAKGG